MLDELATARRRPFAPALDLGELFLGVGPLWQDGEDEPALRLRPGGENGLVIRHGADYYCRGAVLGRGQIRGSVPGLTGRGRRAPT